MGRKRRPRDRGLNYCAPHPANVIKCDVRDIFSTDSTVSGPSAAKIVFGRDGKIYMAIGIPIPRVASDSVSANVTDAQEPNRYYGKVLRLNDDGSAPKDNPFSGRPGYKPEIYALGAKRNWALGSRPMMNRTDPLHRLQTPSKSTTASSTDP